MNNRKAYYDYFIDDEFLAGIILQGAEVKSLRNLHATLDGAFCYLENNEVFVKGIYIKEFENSCIAIDTTRVRKLLLTRREIAKIQKKLEIPGYTLIPLKIEVGPLIKVKIGLARGKKQYDKRETIKERDVQRDLQRNN